MQETTKEIICSSFLRELIKLINILNLKNINSDVLLISELPPVFNLSWILIYVFFLLSYVSAVAFTT